MRRARAGGSGPLPPVTLEVVEVSCTHVTDQDRLDVGKRLASKLVLQAVLLTHAAGQLRVGRLDQAARKDLADDLIGLAGAISQYDDGTGGPEPETLLGSVADSSSE